MDLKKIFSKTLEHSDLNKFRYEASRIMFVIMSAAFFLQYLLIGTGFISKEMSGILTTSFLGFITSFGFYTYFGIQKYFQIDQKMHRVLQGGIVAFCIIVSIPFL